MDGTVAVVLQVRLAEWLQGLTGSDDEDLATLVGIVQSMCCPPRPQEEPVNWGKEGF